MSVDSKELLVGGHESFTVGSAELVGINNSRYGPQELILHLTDGSQLVVMARVDHNIGGAYLSISQLALNR